MSTWYQWATAGAILCTATLLVWRPVAELWIATGEPENLAQRAAEGTLRAAMGTDPPPPPRRWDDDDQGYVY